MNEKMPESDKASPMRSFLGRLLPKGWRKQVVVPPPAPAESPAPPQPRSQLGTVLIVDDDPIILKTTSIKVKSHGYSVLTAMEASQVISIMREDKPDLVLLDINFPPDVAHGATVAWNGFGILTWLRRLEDRPNLPIIIITGSDTEQNRARALAEGAVAFFPKPIDHASLLLLIDQTLRPKAAGSNSKT